MNSHTTAEFAANSHGNAAACGVDRSTLTMLGGPLRTYIGLLQTMFRIWTGPLPAATEWATYGLIAACLSVMRRVTQNLHGARSEPFNHISRRSDGTTNVNFRVAIVRRYVNLSRNKGSYRDSCLFLSP